MSRSSGKRLPDSSGQERPSFPGLLHAPCPPERFPKSWTTRPARPDERAEPFTGRIAAPHAGGLLALSLHAKRQRHHAGAKGRPSLPGRVGLPFPEKCSPCAERPRPRFSRETPSSLAAHRKPDRTVQGTAHILRTPLPPEERRKRSEKETRPSAPLPAGARGGPGACMTRDAQSAPSLGRTKGLPDGRADVSSPSPEARRGGCMPPPAPEAVTPFLTTHEERRLP